MRRFAFSLLAFLASCANAGGVTLKPETLAAWEHYIGLVDASMKNRAESQAFLQLDKSPSQLQQVRQGQVAVWQVKGADGTAVPHGLIHDWLGAVFVPGATLANVFAVIRNYKKYPEWYGPTITRAALLKRTGDQDQFTVHYVRHVLFVTAVLDADYETDYIRVSATQWYSVAHSTRMQEADQDSRPIEKNASDANGYLWRAYTLTRYEQRDKGVYIEQESIGLSRPIPASLRWIAEPVVRRLARDLLAGSLEQTKEAIVSSLAH